MKVDLFVPNLLRCFNCNKFATQASIVKQQQCVNDVGKINKDSSVMDPRYAPTAKVLKLPLIKIVRSKRRRRRFNTVALQKRISFPEATLSLSRSPRQLCFLQVRLLLMWSTRKRVLSLLLIRQILPGSLRTLQCRLLVIVS